MTQRVVGGQTFNLAYDAENRLVSVTGAATASFVYDADGKQVKSVVGGVTTYYVGQHYEKKGTTVTKYYFAGATRLAVRTNGTLSYLLGDHLGSSSVTTDANGVQTASALYKAFGETRYTLGNLGTDYKFTGQRLQAELGIYWFQSRWMDPSLGRFTSPDTIVPTSTQGTQAWDRYGFVNNNPVRYTDPTGHMMTQGDGGCSNPINGRCPAIYTINAGGVTPASKPSVQGGTNDGSPATWLDGVTELLGITNSTLPIFAPPSPHPVDILYTYTVNPDGSIAPIVVTVNNHHGGSAVTLLQVVIGLEDKTMPPPPFSVSVPEGDYIFDVSGVIVYPGEIEHVVIANNGASMPFYSMPIRRNTQITITSVIGGAFDCGAQGNCWLEFNMTYIIPPR